MTVPIVAQRIAVEELRRHGHAVLAPEYAVVIGKPFGVQPPIRLFSVGIEGIEDGPEGEWKGVDAAELAEAIAYSLALEYPRRIGSAPACATRVTP